MGRKKKEVEPTEPTTIEKSTASGVADTSKVTNVVGSTGVSPLVPTSTEVRQKKKRRSKEEIEAEKLEIANKEQSDLRARSVKVAGMLCKGITVPITEHWLPPPLTEAEDEMLAEVWGEVIALYGGDLPPVLAATIVTTSVFMPRFLSRKKVKA